MAYNDKPPIDQGVPGCKPKTRPLQFKRGTSRAWRKANPVLLSGEPGFEVNTYKMKVGDGKSRWSISFVATGLEHSGKQSLASHIFSPVAALIAIHVAYSLAP